MADDSSPFESTLVQLTPYLASQKISLLASLLNARWVNTVASELRAEALAATPNSGSTALPLTRRPAMRRRWRREELWCWAIRRGWAATDGEDIGQ